MKVCKFFFESFLFRNKKSIKVTYYDDAGIAETIMSSQISSQPKPQNDAFKNDFQNARKRNLHLWMRWRSEVNNQLATSVFTGRHRVDVEPLDTYLHKTDHPSENPKTLLTYSASVDNISSLGIKRFLHYGIPRAKTVKKRPFSFTRSKNKDKSSASKYVVEPLLESDEIENVDITVEHNKQANERIITTEKDQNANASFQDINENSNGNVIPYYEPEPDYESPGSPNSPGPGSSIDNITSPGTSFAGNVSNTSSESEPEECPYVQRQRQAELFAARVVKKNIPTISRTYSTLNALDPTYVNPSEVKKNKKNSKKDKKKKGDNDKDGSWKSFESSANSKSTDSKNKRSPLGNLFRKTSDAFTKLSHSKNKGHYAKATDVKLQKKEKESIHKSAIEVIPEDTIPNDSNNNIDRNIYNSSSNKNRDTKGRIKNDSIYAHAQSSKREDLYGNHLDTKRQHSRMESIYGNPRDSFHQQGVESVYANHREIKRFPVQDRSEAVYDSHANSRSFLAFDPQSRFQDSEKVKMRSNQTGKRYQNRDIYKSEYAYPEDLKRRTPLSSNFYGGSMDVYAAGLVEKIEFTQEPRRLGNYRNPDSKIYASHTVLNSKEYDNWGFN